MCTESSHSRTPRVLALTALLCALVGSSLLHTVPAKAALKHAIIVQAVDAGFPPLIQEREPEQIEIAPALTVRNETARERQPHGRAVSRDRLLSSGPD